MAKQIDWFISDNYIIKLSGLTVYHKSSFTPRAWQGLLSAYLATEGTIRLTSEKAQAIVLVSETLFLVI